ncbi:MAG: lipase maturation factor family protein [Bdellovibrionales bacterium]|nr:lipase maturation factor family protein [Bdellovibrionales bacterium]
MTRFVILRLLGAVYFVAFLGLLLQSEALIGHFGLLPIDLWLEARERSLGAGLFAYFSSPTIFWISCDDTFLLACAWLGTVLSLTVALGVSNAAVQFILWALYLSFVEVGQIFYGYGWEIQLLETGFLSIFLCPLRELRPFPRMHRAPIIVVWLLRWLAFRIMFGAGLIKIRADSCWKDFSCLLYHFETQPLPNPLSPFFHRLPAWLLKSGVLFNHLVELLAPWMMLGPRRLRIVGGLLTISFQLILILSGNLSWLNWLTIIAVLACFDDSFWQSFVRVVGKDPEAEVPLSRRVVLYLLVGTIGILSVFPIVNMLSASQAMNASFEPLRLVNTYGAFGSVGSRRAEVVLEVTDSAKIDADTEWRELDFPCKPGSLDRAPCVVAPYQPRLDWQIWFAAMSRIESNPWLIHLTAKILAGEPRIKELLAKGTLDGPSPKYLRALLYQYKFQPPDEEPRQNWWSRQLLGVYLDPVSLADPGLRHYLEQRGWLERLQIQNSENP